MQVGAISLEDLLSGGMSREDREEAEQKHKERFPEAQVRGMLKEALAILDTHYEFQRGDIVRRKRGLEDNRRESCGGVMIFLSKILPNSFDWEPATRGAPIGLYDTDCIIGEILPNGAMAEYAMCSRYLEPAPEPVA